MYYNIFQPTKPQGLPARMLAIPLQGIELCCITVCTIVQNCCKGDEPCQWNTPIFRPSGIENPWPDRHQIWRGDYVGDITPHANFGISIPMGAVVHMREIVIIRVYFYTPLLFDFLHICRGHTVWPIFVFYGSKDVFPWQLRPFGLGTKN